MATNRVYANGEYLYLPVASGVESGDPVQIGDQGLVGVALTDRDADGKATVQLAPGPVFDLPVTSAAGQLDIGDRVYITSGGAVTRDASGNNVFGWALEGLAADTAGTIQIKVSGQPAVS